MKQYLHIKTDGTSSVIDIPEEGDAEFRQLSDLVGGYIEQVRTYGNHRLVVNETGHLDGLEENLLATVISGRLGARFQIVGDTVLAGPLKGDGEFDTVAPTVIAAANAKPGTLLHEMLGALGALQGMPDRAGNGGIDANE